MNLEVRQAAEAREIRRLCHFTPSRNLQHIAAGKVGILSTASLEADERAAFNATDLARYDQRKSHICCSVEFPNAWYFFKARNDDRLFEGWVVLLIAPRYLWTDDTLFSSRNAASGFGRNIASGVDAFEGMFAPTVPGANRTYTRTVRQRAATTTDQQAEVLVPDRINMSDILAIAVRDEDQARTERTGLRTNGVDPDLFKFVIAPHFFDRYGLSDIIRSGSIPNEPIFQWKGGPHV